MFLSDDQMRLLCGRIAVEVPRLLPSGRVSVSLTQAHDKSPRLEVDYFPNLGTTVHLVKFGPTEIANAVAGRQATDRFIDDLGGRFHAMLKKL
jgi:hypothetical protein